MTFISVRSTIRLWDVQLFEFPNDLDLNRDIVQKGSVPDLRDVTLFERIFDLIYIYVTKSVEPC